jgi:hypothetical protein
LISVGIGGGLVVVVHITTPVVRRFHTSIPAASDMCSHYLGEQPAPRDLVTSRIQVSRILRSCNGVWSPGASRVQVLPALVAVRAVWSWV